MSTRTEIEELRRRLGQLARESESSLHRRYALRFPPGVRLNLYRRARIMVGRLLRWLGLRRAIVPEPWLPGLKHAEFSHVARPLVIWALDTDRDSLRAACRGIQALQVQLPGWVPVLVTDVADFAFFSRLGWLVEYVPTLSEPATGYRERKQRYLAWRYRDSPALPLSVGLRDGVQVQELMIGCR